MPRRDALFVMQIQEHMHANKGLHSTHRENVPAPARAADQPLADCPCSAEHARGEHREYGLHLY